MFNPKVWTDCFKVSFKYLAVINFAKKALTSVIVTVVIIACPVKNRLIIILIFKIMMYGEIVGHIGTLFTISIKKIHRIVNPSEYFFKYKFTRTLFIPRAS